MTLTKDIEQAEKERDVLEKVAMATIRTIVQKTEAVTGRKLQDDKLQRIVMPKPEVPIGPWVEECARIISTSDNWHFENPCDFLKWARPYFERGWVD